jgi:ribosome recycling factor
MYQEIIKNLKPQLNKTLDYLKTELNSLQVGRAAGSIVENIEVEAYNARMPLKQLAAINTPDPKQIVVQPYDKEIIKNIEKALRDSKRNLSLVVDDDCVRVTIPPLSEERRKELVKIVKEKVEECHVSIRRSREDAWRAIVALEQQKKITEDDRYKAKDQLQEVIDDYNKQIDDIGLKKESDILKV